MSDYYAMYDDTGQITRVVRDTPEGVKAWGEPYLPVSDRVDDRIHYVLDGQLVERPTLDPDVRKTEIRADGVDEAIISGLPPSITLKVDDEDVTIPDGVFAFSAIEKGTYVVECRQFPYRDWRLEIVAT